VLTSATTDARFVAVAGKLIREDLDISGSYWINGTRVLTARQSAIANNTTTVTGTAGLTYDSDEQQMINQLKADVISLSDKLNTTLNMLRTHGLIGS
jgi:hypothetical protein